MSTLSSLKAGTWNADASHSEVGFAARRALVSKIRGQFKDFAAVVTIAAPFEQSSVEATVQMGSIDTSGADRDTNLKRGADRDADLKSVNFLDVKNHPTMTFKSTLVKKIGQHEHAVTGDLTLHGVIRPVTFAVEGPSAPGKDPWGNTRIGLLATTKINRKDFGLAWNAALETGGVLVGEDVSITLDVQFVKG